MRFMKTLILTLSIFFSFVTFSQSSSEYCGFGKSNTAAEKIDQMPEFRGTSDSNQVSVEIRKYVQRKMYFRFKTFRSSGIVCLSYIVNEKGKIEEVTIIKGANEELDKIAYRLIKKMPRWKPGIHNGKTVKVQYSIPLKFKAASPTI